MREIVTISASHRANHLITQFFNGQERALHERGDGNSDANVFLNGTIDADGRTMSYEPRAVLWDAKGGSGALGRFQYWSQADYVDAEVPSGRPGVEVVQTAARVPRSAYQRALDAGEAPPALTAAGARYWSDYGRMIYGQDSVQELAHWHHDVEAPSAPDFEALGQRRFDKYENGYAVFSEECARDFFDTSLHRQLEQCDTLQGFNLVTETENGWGGFMAALQEQLREEVPKVCYFGWGLNVDDPVPRQSARSGFQQQCNRLRATLAMVDQSDLYFPLRSEATVSLWEAGGWACHVLDSVNSVMCLEKPRTFRYMNQLADRLHNGDEQRNVVSLIASDLRSYSYFAEAPRHRSSPTDPHIFSRCRLLRNVHSPLKSTLSVENLEEIRTSAWLPADTIPEVARNLHHVDLGVTEKSRDVFKQWYEMVTRQFRYDPDREELKERLGTLSAAYECGWYSDDDSGDDT
ncbi:AaceriAER340Wp [[Ashbya] aceris (nom. inval.)]|nr:AaceriAER340Wp [[Ashbya] aceris (nom. inval.)]